MILTKPTPWGVIYGKLSTTPEQAKRMFGFDQHPDAVGVVIQRFRNKKGETQFRIGNRFKQKGEMSPRRKKICEVFGVLAKIFNQEKGVLVNPISWRPDKPTRCPYNMFIAVNTRRIGVEHEWKNMLITDGYLQSPDIKKVSYDPDRLVLSIPELKEDMGVGVFDAEGYKFFLFTPPNSSEILLKEKLINPIVYIYKKEGDSYSKSVSVIPERRDSFLLAPPQRGKLRRRVAENKKYRIQRVFPQ